MGSVVGIQNTSDGVDAPVRVRPSTTSKKSVPSPGHRKEVRLASVSMQAGSVYHLVDTASPKFLNRGGMSLQESRLN